MQKVQACAHHFASFRRRAREQKSSLYTSSLAKIAAKCAAFEAVTRQRKQMYLEKATPMNAFCLVTTSDNGSLMKFRPEKGRRKKDHWKSKGRPKLSEKVLAWLPGSLPDGLQHRPGGLAGWPPGSVTNRTIDENSIKNIITCRRARNSPVSI